MTQTQIDLLATRIQRLERIVDRLKEAVVDLVEDAYGDLPEVPAPFAAADGVPPEEVARMQARYEKLTRLGRNRVRLRAEQ